MTERTIDPQLKTSLLNNEPFLYYNLIKFERPQLATIDGQVSKTATDYSYLTDAPFNVPYDDLKGQGEQTYIANKVLTLGTINETIEAKATTMTLKLATSALGSYIYNASIDVDTNSTYFETSLDLGLEGFREGDKIVFSGGTNDGKFVRLDRFAIGTSGIRNSKAFFTEIGTGMTPGSDTCTISIASEEIRNLTSLKEGGATVYSSYLNREVFVYRVHADPETGAIKGNPFLLFRGIISSASLDERPDGSSSISWGLTSHWGDFVRANGRLTSDSAHRALAENGRPDYSAIVRPEYAFDYGFMHAERAVNVIAQFTYKELRYKYHDASLVNQLTFGLFGSGPSMTEEWIDVERDVDLRFNLNARYLPVVYGVQKVENNPIFVDVHKDDSEIVYIAYALCEGEIGGIYDIYIDDQPSVCLDDADEGTRTAQFFSDPAKNVSVLCYGRADKGDVLDGESYLTGSPVQQLYDTLNEEFIREGFTRDGAMFSTGLRETQLNPTHNLTSSKGIGHEQTYSFQTPIDVAFVVHTGKPDQEANQEILRLADEHQFKVQTSYFKGLADDYWSSSHRLLDTAYVVGKFELSQGEESFPEYKFVVKGKYIDCHNYDYSFKVVSGNTDLYEPGDTVNLNTGTSVTYSGIQIIDKWTMYDKDGNEEVRFRWATNYPNDGDTVVQFEKDVELTMSGATEDIVMRPSGYILDTGDITSEITGILQGTPTRIQETDGEKLTFNFAGQNPFLDVLGYGGVDNVTISCQTKRNISFTVTEISGSTVYVAPYEAAINIATNQFSSGDVFVVSNCVPITNTSTTAEDGNILKIARTQNNATEYRTKRIKKVDATNGYLFTESPFTEEFYPQAGDSFIAEWQHKDLRVSTNPAMQLLDYVTSKRYGQGLDIDEDINLDTWMESARLCDDRSKVSVVVNSTESLPDPGDICTLRTNGSLGRLLFQGKVIEVNQVTTDYAQVVFDETIGKLGYKWSTARHLQVGDFVWWDGKVVQVTSIPDVTHGVNIYGYIDDSGDRNLFFAQSASPMALNNLTGGGNFTINTTETLGGLRGTNPIVRAWSETDQNFSAPGYSLYDSDDVVYWKYLGWEEWEQRYVTRHQMNQIVNTTTPIFDNINAMLTQFNGMLRYVNGKYELDVRTAAPSVTSLEQGVHRLSENDIIGNLKLDDKGQKKSYNSISANILDPQNKFSARSVTFFDSTYLREDRGISKQGKIGLNGITNYYNARNNVVQFLKESRYGLTINFTMDQKGYLLLPGEIIALSYSRFEWYDKYFRVQSLDIQNDGLVRITAKEHNDNAYYLDYSDRDLSYASGTIFGTNIIDPPTGIDATDYLDGAIQLTWNNTLQYDPALYDIEIWAVEAGKDSNGYILDSTGDPEESFNDRNNATLLDKTDGDSYIHVMVGDPPSNYSQHVWYYWIRYVKPPTGYRAKTKYSAWEPLGAGTVGKSFKALADTARSVNLTANSLVAFYDEAGLLINPTTSDITFTANPFGYAQDPYYTFYVLNINGGIQESQQVNPNTDDTGTYIYSPPDDIGVTATDPRWMPEIVMVEMREGSQAGALQAIDMVVVQGLSDASAPIRVDNTNPSHYAPIDAEGVLDLEGSGTEISVWEGETTLNAVLAADPENLGNIPTLQEGEFTVMVQSVSDTGAVTFSSPWTKANNTITVTDHTAIDVERVQITYLVVIRRYNGLTVNWNVYQNIVRVGNFGARTCSVVPSDTSVVYSAAGDSPDYSGWTGGIVITAYSEGYTDPYYQLRENGVIYDAYTQADTDGTRTWQYDVPDLLLTDGETHSFELETKEGSGGSTSSHDVQSVVYIRGGKDGVAAWLSNSNHEVVADKNGENYNLVVPDSGGLFEFFAGGTDVRASVTFKVDDVDPDTNGISESDHGSGLYFSIENGGATPGTYSVTDYGGSWTSDQEVFTVTGTFLGVTYTRKYTITKRKDGKDGRTIIINASTTSIVYDTEGSYAPGIIVLTADAFGYDDPEYGWWSELDDTTNAPLADCTIWTALNDQSSYGSTYGNVASFYPPPTFDDWAGPCAVKCYVKESSDTTPPFTTVRYGLLLIFPVAPGVSAINPVLTNQFHPIAETPEGIIYSGTGTTISVYEGTEKLNSYDDAGNDSGNTSIPPSLSSTKDSVADKWGIQSRTYGGGLAGLEGNTPPLVYVSGDDLLVGDLTSAGNLDPWTNMNELTGWCDYVLRIRRKSETTNYRDITMRQLFTRNVEGAAGESTYLPILSNPVPLVPTENQVTGYDNADWTNSGTDIEVWYGPEKIVYEPTLTTSGVPCWRVLDVYVDSEYLGGDGIYDYSTTPDGFNTGMTVATFNPHNNGDTTPNWVDPQAIVQYHIQVADAEGAIVVDQIYKQTITRVPGGNAVDGRDALTFILGNETHAFPCSEGGVVLSYANSGTTISGYYGDDTFEYDPYASATNNNAWRVAYVVESTEATTGEDIKAQEANSGVYSTGSNVVEFGDHSAFQDKLDTAYVEYWIEGWYEDGVRFPATGYIVKKQTLSKNKNGSSVRILPTSKIIPYGARGLLNTDDETTPGNYSVTFATKVTGVANPVFEWSLAPNDISEQGSAFFDYWTYAENASSITWTNTSTQGGATGDIPDYYSPEEHPTGATANTWLGEFSGSFTIKVEVKEQTTDEIMCEDKETIFCIKESLDGYWADVDAANITVESSPDLLEFPVGPYGYVIDPGTGTGFVGTMTVHKGSTDITASCTFEILNPDSSFEMSGNSTVQYQKKNDLYLTLFLQDSSPFVKGQFAFQGYVLDSGQEPPYIYWNTANETFIIRATAPNGLQFDRQVSCSKNPRGASGSNAPREPDGGGHNGFIKLADAYVRHYSQSYPNEPVGLPSRAFWRMTPQGFLYTFVLNLPNYLPDNPTWYQQWLWDGAVASHYDVNIRIINPNLAGYNNVGYSTSSTVNYNNFTNISLQGNGYYETGFMSAATNIDLMLIAYNTQAYNVATIFVRDATSTTVLDTCKVVMFASNVVSYGQGELP